MCARSTARNGGYLCTDLSVDLFVYAAGHVYLKEFDFWSLQDFWSPHTEPVSLLASQRNKGCCWYVRFLMWNACEVITMTDTIIPHTDNPGTQHSHCSYSLPAACSC